MGLIPYAKEHSIDLISRGKGFRLWLEKMPFVPGTLPWILEDIHHIMDFEKDGAKQAKAFYPRADQHELREELLDSMKRTVWYDLVISTLGKPLKADILESHGFSLCHICGLELYDGFFEREMLSRSLLTRCCKGCSLIAILNMENHNFLQLKSEVAQSLFERAKTPRTYFLFETKLGAEAIAKSRGLAKQSQNRCFDRAQEKYWSYHKEILEGEQYREDVAIYDCCNKRETLKNIERLQKSRDVLYTQLGGQVKPVVGRERAADWNVRKRDYLLQRQVEEDNLVNRGPHPGLGK
ncbi:uncharacterized protein BCR38DRAFT_124698 [Pseudomassariella vexata]|uniref:Uncharacterized protein n=1 Tax=Pseudomassariella vexata TaxID=1141098 RepID=A0A1Y2D8C2_9PEZI|nr:uncharacterized protein BCR38DRAFT_124698 [Pseudomassariella vexata]ORY55467.1 hypothetical protein BCR38DRAFT_124698 [Pseudomassariella vexata]